MNKKYSLATIFTFLFISLYGQYSINDYKYVIVEKQFHFQTEPNQYDLNRMVKFQFEKLGFSVIVEGQGIPDDLKSNYCLALASEVTAKGLLRTKARVTLKNCHGEDVFISGEGITKEKDLTRAFDVAIRKAFDSMQGLNYRYVPNEAVTSVGGNSAEVKKAEEKIEQLEAEIKELKEEKAESRESTSEKVEAVTETANIATNSTSEEVKEEDPFSDFLKTEVAEGGYIVKDPSGQNVLFRLIKTKMQDVFLTSNNSGIVYKNDNGEWVREFEEDGKTKTEVLKIKF